VDSTLITIIIQFSGWLVGWLVFDTFIAPQIVTASLNRLVMSVGDKGVGAMTAKGVEFSSPYQAYFFDIECRGASKI